MNLHMRGMCCTVLCQPTLQHRPYVLLAPSMWLQSCMRHRKRCCSTEKNPDSTEKASPPGKNMRCSQTPSKKPSTEPDKALFRPCAAKTAEPDRVPAAVIKSGNILDFCAKRLLQPMLAAPLRKSRPLIHHRYGTMCSGSEVVKFVLASLSQALSDEHVFIPVFTCECEKDKREWIMHLESAEVCCFTNIVDMGSATAPCARHGKNCRVVSVDGLVIRLSCKDLVCRV